ASRGTRASPSSTEPTQQHILQTIRKSCRPAVTWAHVRQLCRTVALRVGARKAGSAMRVGSFVLAAQFPGQGQGEALHRAVRSAEVGEEAGLDSVWLGERHLVPYGTCPSAITLAALLLGRTRRLRVGTAVTVLPT